MLAVRHPVAQTIEPGMHPGAGLEVAAGVCGDGCSAWALEFRDDEASAVTVVGALGAEGPACLCSRVCWGGAQARVQPSAGGAGGGGAIAPSAPCAAADVFLDARCGDRPLIFPRKSGRG